MIRNPVHLAQCAANFSEGRRPEVVDAIVEAMASANGATVIDYSLDTDHNRSVITVLGKPECVAEAAFRGVARAVELIDLNTHEGQHPRIGAADVIPIVPLGETPMEECVEATVQLAKRIADELSVPVFLYEQSASYAHRKNLPDIRRGGFEHLKEVGLSGKYAPDYGPHQVHPTAGVCVVGARGPLVAYNIVLRTSDMHIARRIANAVREATGGLRGVRALGMELASCGLVQISMNITRPDLVPLYRVYELVRREAEAYGVTIAESELIGALPLSQIIATARHSLQLHDMKDTQIIDLWYPIVDTQSE